MQSVFCIGGLGDFGECTFLPIQLLKYWQIVNVNVVCEVSFHQELQKLHVCCVMLCVPMLHCATSWQTVWRTQLLPIVLCTRVVDTDMIMTWAIINDNCVLCCNYRTHWTLEGYFFGAVSLWTDLHQIHTEDVFGPSFGRLWRSRSLGEKPGFWLFRRPACGLCLVKHI